MVFGVYEEYNPGDFGKVVFPEAAGFLGVSTVVVREVGDAVEEGRKMGLRDVRAEEGEHTLLMAAEVEGCEAAVADSKFFGG